MAYYYYESFVAGKSNSPVGTATVLPYMVLTVIKKNVYKKTSLLTEGVSTSEKSLVSNHQSGPKYTVSLLVWCSSFFKIAIFARVPEF